ncbi:MAG: hypothetical protein P4M13_02785 [Alphaproteobacteria bacterium]|nr:hypothetical protein [Alphaproteobacteria bacterium]
MAFAIRVTDEYVGLMGRHVAEGQSIVPGAPLLDVMTPDGIVKTILSEGWGVVAHIEGGRIFSNVSGDDAFADDDEYTGEENEGDEDGESGSAQKSGGGRSCVFPRGSVICHVVACSQEGSTRKTGLHPRNATGPRYRREMGIAPC